MVNITNISYHDILCCSSALHAIFRFSHMRMAVAVFANPRILTRADLQCSHTQRFFGSLMESSSFRWKPDGSTTQPSPWGKHQPHQRGGQQQRLFCWPLSFSRIAHALIAGRRAKRLARHQPWKATPVFDLYLHQEAGPAAKKDPAARSCWAGVSRH
jgi:hypothetical protein